MGPHTMFEETTVATSLPPYARTNSIAARPGRISEPEIMAAIVSKICCFAFSTTSSGSARSLASLMYLLSLSITGLTPCAASSSLAAALAAATPGGRAVDANARPASSSRERRVRTAPPLPASLSLPSPCTMCVLLLRALRAGLNLLKVVRAEWTQPRNPSYVINRIKCLKTVLILFNLRRHVLFDSNGDHLVFRQRLHNAKHFALRLKPYTGNLWQLDVAVFDRYPVGKSTERLKNSRIGFVAPQPQTGRDVQRHLMPSVRNAANRRPSIFLQHAQDSKVFD